MESERDKLIIRNAILNYTLQGFMYLLNFLSLPLSLNFLGKERYGIFEILLTMLSWASLANLGLGNGLRNKIAYALAEKKNDLIKYLIGATFLLSAMIIVVLLIVGNIVIYYFLDFNWFFKSITIPIEEIKLSFSISFSLFCFALFLDIFSSIALGIHKSYINSLTKVGYLALYTLFLFIVIKFQIQSSLLVSSTIYGLATILGYFSAYAFIVRRKDIWPPIFSRNKIYYKSLFSLSMSFFILQITTIIFFSSDNLIISKLLGPTDVTSYSIINKVFFIIIALFTIILVQIWNSTSDAFAKKDFIWIRKTIKRLHIILVPFIIASIIIAIMINPLITIWLRQEFNFPVSIRILFVLYMLIHCSNGIYGNILNGVGKLRWQTIAYFIASLLHILLSYFFIAKIGTGYTGVLYSKLICISIIYIICLLDYKTFMKLNKE